MKKFVKRILSMSFVLAMVLSVIPNSAFAYSEDTNAFDYPGRGFNIGTILYLPGSYSKQTGLSNMPRQQMTFTDYTDGATYSCVSSNPAVLTVNGIENKSVLVTGIAPGTVTLTLYRSVNGKTTIIGKSTGTVHAATLTCYGNYTHTYGLGDYITSLQISNRNLNATYTWTVDKPGLKVYDALGEDNITHKGTETAVGTIPGVYKVTVTENYNGVVRTLKTITMNIVNHSVNPTLTMYVGQALTVANSKLGISNVASKGEGNILNNKIQDVVGGGYRVEAKGIDNLYTPAGEAANTEAFKWMKTPVCFTTTNFVWAAKEGTIVVDVYKINKPDQYDFKSGLKIVETPDITYVGSCTITVLPASMNPENAVK